MEKPSSQVTQKFITLYDEMADQLFRHCFFKLSQRELALDIVQESFTRTWSYLSEGKEVENIKGFIFKVANNLIIDEYRKKKTLSLDALQEVGFDASFDQKKEGLKYEADYILAHIDKLEKKYKEVIIMRYVNDYSPKEIANLIGESENAVSVRINRGIKKIQKILKIRK